MILYRHDEETGQYIAVHDTEAYNGLSDGCWMVMVDKGCTSIRKSIEPARAALQFAAMMMSNKICKYLAAVSELQTTNRANGKPYTKNQLKIIKQLHKLPDEDKFLYFQYDSLQGMSENILKLILDDYDSSVK
jgi:hypothetical protein